VSTIQSVDLPQSQSNGVGPDSKYAREYAAFQRLLPSLIQTHLGQFVAIHDGRVIASGVDRLQVVNEALLKNGGADIHVGLVGPERVPGSRSGLLRDVSAEAHSA
jgi:hypothetical protein